MKRTMLIALLLLLAYGVTITAAATITSPADTKATSADAKKSASPKPTRYTPIQLAVWDPVQIFPHDWTVFLVRINLPYGYNDTVIGLDAGVVNVAGRLYGAQFGVLNGIYNRYSTPSGTSGGVQVALANLCFADFFGVQGSLLNLAAYMTGLQVGGYNASTNGLAGIQLGAYNHVTDGVGIQAGAVNCAFRDGALYTSGAGKFNGLQVAVVANWVNEMNGMQIGVILNRTKESYAGVQIGLINIADRIRGVQIGLVNMTRRMSGVQIGLINIIQEGALPVFPIFNASMTY